MRRTRWIVGAGVLVAWACGGKQDPGDAGPDARLDADPDARVCSYRETRTSADRACMTAADCVVVSRSVSCCQEQFEGIRKDAAAKFQADQAALTAGCPACGCAAQPIDDTGQKGNSSFGVTCDNGLCTSHAQ